MEAANLEAFVEWTDFGTVRRHLRIAKSPVTSVLFAGSRNLLGEVATILDWSNERSEALRLRQLNGLLEAGQIAVGEIGHLESCGLGVDMDHLPEDTLCHVIYHSPFYLVHVPGLKLDGWRRRGSLCCSP